MPGNLVGIDRSGDQDLALDHLPSLLEHAKIMVDIQMVGSAVLDVN
jgi:hypothetical protein